MRKLFFLLCAVIILLYSSQVAQAHSGVNPDMDSPQAPSSSLIRNTIISSNATAISSYNTNVNIASYRQQSILYYPGYQFVSWYNGNARNVIVGRRTLNVSNMSVGAWQWAYVNFSLSASSDSHSVMSLA